MRKAFLQLHIAVFLAGFTGILGRLITVNAGMIVWIRLLFTATTMWVLFPALRQVQKIPSRLRWQIMGVGVVAAFHWLTFYAAIKEANVSVALVCFAATSFFTALFEPFFLRKAVNWGELLLGLITMSGIYVIFHFDTHYKAGILLGVSSAILAAVFPIFNREYLKKTNVQTLLLWQQTGGFIGLCLLLPLFFQLYPAREHFWPGWSDIGWLLVLSWGCSVVAFQFSSNALKKLSAFTASLTFNLEPVYGIILAFLIYHENEYLSNWFYVGVGIIALALIVHIFILVKRERKLTANDTE